MKRILILLALLGTACSSTIRDFDFRNPGCVPQFVAKKDKVEVRSTGSGGVLIRWKGDAILIGPFFSNHNPVIALVGDAVPDKRRVREELAKMRIDDVRAILAGHSHYDHLGDVPFIVENYLPGVKLFVNQSGANMLAPYRFDVRSYENAGTIAITPRIRFTAYEHGHAPQFQLFGHALIDYAHGDVEEPWTTRWEQRKLRHLKGGTTHGFLIELHDDSGRRFRIYYNDAAAKVHEKLPKGPIDLAIFCLPGAAYVEGAPRDILERLQPRHVLIAHFEDFFRKHADSWTFPFGLTSGQAERFISAIEQAVDDPAGPLNEVCGVATEKWSMPVPRSQLWFNPR